MGALIECRVGRRAATLAFAAALAASLSFPALAFAEVKIDDTVLSQGENAVGGGTATLADTVLDMVNVVANSMSIVDENLTVNFNGGNDIDDDVIVEGSSDVTVNFAGENDVEDFKVKGDSTLTVNANGHDDLEELKAYDNANLIVNVTGENEFEEIVGKDNANVTVRGTDCQRKDILNIEDHEKALLRVENGNLTIDHVTVNLMGSKRNIVGSIGGNVIVDTSKIKADNGTWTWLEAGGTLQIRESVIEFAGEVFSRGLMTIKHSDLDISKSKVAQEDIPYRVFSYEGIKLIDEKNGEVLEGTYKDDKVWYVDTDGNSGSDVHLKADGEPAYYKCSTSALPKAGDNNFAQPFALLAAIGFITALFAQMNRRRHHGGKETR